MMLLALFAALQTPDPAGGNDSWPGWRGPHGSGVARGSPPIEWSEQENVRWKTPVPGKGLSCPVVWEGQVFLTTAIGTGKKAESAPAEDGEDGEDGEGGERGENGEGGERPAGRQGGRGRGGRGGPPAPLEEQDFSVLALDRKTGAVQWQKKLTTAMPHQGTHSDGSYASPTPVTDGERLYVSFGSFGIHALSLKGEVLWSVDLGDMDIENGFGEGSSPVLFGELVILTWDHEGDSFLVALDKQSGKERWRTARARGTNWTTPVFVTVAGQPQLVTAGPLTVAYDPTTGKELWREGEPSGLGNVIAGPVLVEELVIYARGGRGGGEARALVAHAGQDGKEDGAPVEPLLWKVKFDGPHVPSPLAYDGKVYMLKQDSGLLSVLDPTSGEVLYGPERLKGVANVYASLVAANGHLYVAGRDGTVEVLSTWPKIESVAVNVLEDGFDSSPAIAGDELFLRGKAHLYCIAK